MGKILGHKGLMALASFDGSFGRFALIYCLHVMSKLEEKKKDGPVGRRKACIDNA